jgi:hypothetical protein
MANTGRSQSGLVPGATYYMVVVNALGQYLNLSGPAFENFNASHWANYVTASAVANAAGWWYGVVPANAAMVAGTYTLGLQKQAGGSPADTDASVAQVILWDGANIVTLQDFNNTGQVNPLPIILPYGFSVISATGTQSTTYTGETLNAVINYPFTFTWQYIGANSTGWTQFVWTVKALETDPDANAILTIKVTNPSSGSDGLILQNGTAPVSATEGSLVVSLAPVAGQTATTITVSLNATGMGLAAVLSGFWETTVYLSGVKQPQFDGGPFIVNASVRAAAGQA